LRTSVVAARRQPTFAAGGMGTGMGGMSFTINGWEFNEARTDTTAAGQTVEEWTLKSSSLMDHPFHLHVRLQEVRGEPARGDSRVSCVEASEATRHASEDFRPHRCTGPLICLTLGSIPNSKYPMGYTDKAIHSCKGATRCAVQ
jgi:hypothetical protein